MKFLSAFVLFFLMATSSAFAFGSASKHSEGQITATSGQAALAEIAAIVADLQADPKTDWSKVDIDALRAHLVDMNNVVLHALVQTSQVSSGAEFKVTSDDPLVVQSIQNMTRAHGSMMSAEGLQWETTLVRDGSIVRVTAQEDQQVEMIFGLGFFGLLALGNHHGFHHQMLATGQNPH